MLSRFFIIFVFFQNVHLYAERSVGKPNPSSTAPKIATGYSCNRAGTDKSQPYPECSEASTPSVSVMCANLNTNPKPCMRNSADNDIPCYWDAECCSGYCQTLSGTTKGQCADTTNRNSTAENYYYPFLKSVYLTGQTDGSNSANSSLKKVGDDCVNDNECIYNVCYQSKCIKRKLSIGNCTSNDDCASGTCDHGSCVSLKICRKCTKRTFAPTMGVPCCNGLSVSKTSQTCDDIPVFLGADILNQLYSSRMVTDHQGIASADSGGNSTAPVPWDTLTPVIDSGMCEIKSWTVGSQKYSLDDLKNEIRLRDNIVLIFEFLHNFDITSNSNIPSSFKGTEIKQDNADKVFYDNEDFKKHLQDISKYTDYDKQMNKVPMDIFGFYDQINKATASLYQTRYDVSYQIALQQVKNMQFLHLNSLNHSAPMLGQRENIFNASKVTAMKAEGYLKAMSIINGVYKKRVKDDSDFNDRKVGHRGREYKLMWLLPDPDDPDAPGSTRKAAVEDALYSFHRISASQEEHAEGLSDEEMEENKESNSLGTNAVFGVHASGDQSCSSNDKDMEEWMEGNGESESEAEFRGSIDKFCTGTRIWTRDLAGSHKDDADFLPLGWGKYDYDKNMDQREKNDISPSYINTYPALDYFSTDQLDFTGYEKGRGLKYNLFLFKENYAAHARQSTLDSDGNSYGIQFKSSDDVDFSALDDDSIKKVIIPRATLALTPTPNSAVTPSVAFTPSPPSQAMKEAFLQYVKDNIIVPRERAPLDLLIKQDSKVLWNVFELMTYSPYPIHPSSYGRYMVVFLDQILSELYSINIQMSYAYDAQAHCLNDLLVNMVNKANGSGTNVNGSNVDNSFFGSVFLDSNAYSTAPSSSDPNNTGANKSLTLGQGSKALANFLSTGNYTYTDTMKSGAGSSPNIGKVKGNSSQTFNLKQTQNERQAFFNFLKKNKADFEKKFGGTSIGKAMTKMNDTANSMTSNMMKGMKDAIKNSANNLNDSIQNVPVPESNKKANPNSTPLATAAVNGAQLNNVSESQSDGGGNGGYGGGGVGFIPNVNKDENKPNVIVTAPATIKKEASAIQNRPGTSIFKMVTWRYFQHYFGDDLKGIVPK